MAQRIRAVATDIDATLTDRRRRLDLRAVAALRRLEDRGIPVILASGNVLPYVKALSIFAGFSGPLVAENGGVVHWNDRERVFASRARAEAALDRLKKIVPGVKSLSSNRWRVSAIAIEQNLDVAAVRKALSGRGFRIGATGYGIHIMEPGLSKMRGVREACRWLGMSPSQVAAFGDSAVDIPMLRGCGCGIAVGNAIPSVRAAADHVTAARYGAGVVEGLRWLGRAGYLKP